MMSQKVVLRADGNAKIGLGHIVRSLAIASMLKNDFFCEFAIHSPSEHIKKQLLDVCESVIEIDNVPQAFFDYLTGDEIVILDGYHFDTNYQKAIKAKGCKLVCIDDLHDKHFVSDVVINHAPGVRIEDYSVETYTQVCLGPDFALLRPSFLKLAGTERKINRIDTVFVCFGGADPKNITEVVVKKLLEYSQFTHILVVAGSAYKGGESLDILVQDNLDRLTRYNAVDEKTMIKLLQESQLAIVPASGILFEVLSVKVPVISGYYIENQQAIYQGFLNQQVIFDAGSFEPTQIDQALRSVFDADLNEILTRQGLCIDGGSVSRIKETVLNLCI
ncbi:UDP-2,4-diacetamido-2,4,6-trideoxy-beta-L-altropyranose hydrolase [Rapidithrix thailandica]|uniref:UDP-2,4-diacetamido-2,4, 6-trideoxy-beta-L-altropyranose hydrolase n=1 Tax=Rapidithrix thailandica TaxID=413964 RepID=A0AAW9SMD9_9BACT